MNTLIRPRKPMRVAFSLWSRCSQQSFSLNNQQWRRPMSNSSPQPANQDNSSSSNVTRQHRIHRKITTLNPMRLQPTDLVDISGFKVASFSFGYHGRCELRYGYRDNGIVAFPQNTRGFLYYHVHDNLPPMCNEVRFRIADSASLAGFESGTDLMFHPSIPWSISTLGMTFKNYACMLNRLEYDLQIPKSLVDSMQNLREKYMLKRHDREMYYLEQPFVYHMAQQKLRLRVLTTSEVHNVQIQGLFRDHRAGDDGHFPYSGRLLLRFERSMLPDDIGTNTAVLRVLKILDPITLTIPGYDGYVPLPQARELVIKRKLQRTYVCSWNLDEETNHIASALKGLPSISDSDHAKILGGPTLLPSNEP